VKRYEGLFILNTAAREEGIKDIIDKVSAEITAGGGRVETVQKMDKRAFVRVANKKHTGGFYVNVIFETQPSAVTALRKSFVLSEDIFRVLLSEAAAPKAEVKAN
jgi:ribosomal protein S6